MSFDLELTTEEVDRIFNKHNISTKPGNETLDLDDDEVNAILGARGYNLANEKRPDSSKFGKAPKPAKATKDVKTVKPEHREHKSHSKAIVQGPNKVERKHEHGDKHTEKKHSDKHVEKPTEKKHSDKHVEKPTEKKVERKPKSTNKLIELTKESEYHQLLKGNERVVLFFGSEGCPACQALHPLYERIAKRYGDKVQLAYADVDKYQISFRYVPVFQIYYRGEKKDEIIGASVEELKAFIAQAIKTK